MGRRMYAYRSHEFDGRHFRSLYTHVLLLLGEVRWGDLRCEVDGLGGFGFRLPDAGYKHGQIWIIDMMHLNDICILKVALAANELA